MKLAEFLGHIDPIFFRIPAGELGIPTENEATQTKELFIQSVDDRKLEARYVLEILSDLALKNGLHKIPPPSRSGAAEIAASLVNEPEASGKTDITSSQPAAPKPTSPIQPAPTRQQRTPLGYNIQHYIGATIWGFIATGTIAMVLTGGVLALSAVAGILGAGGGAFLMNMYKNSSGKSLFGEGKFLFGEPYKNWDLPKEHRQSAPAPTQRERHRQAYEATIKERESKLARVETGFLQEETQTQECEKCR
mgnify:FL=1